MASGIFLASRQEVHVGLCLAVLGLSIASMLTRLRHRIGPVFALTGSLGLGAWLYPLASDTCHLGTIGSYASGEGTISRLRCTVATDPAIVLRPAHAFSRWSYGGDRTTFIGEVEAIETDSGFAPASGRVRVSVAEPVPFLGLGDRVELFGRLRALQPPRNPGGFDWSAYSRRRGIGASVHCRHRENVQRLDLLVDPTRDPSTLGEDAPRHSSALRKIVRGLRRTAQRLLLENVSESPSEHGGLLEAMILGQRSGVSRRVNDSFIRAGCAHFLAVSGAHVAMLMAFVWLLGRLAGLRHAGNALLVLLVLILYVLVAEPRPPILRAGVMGALFCLSILWYRPAASLNWLAASAALLLLVDPDMLFDIGFQLSMAAVTGVIVLTGPLQNLASVARRLFDSWVLRDPFRFEDRRIRRMDRIYEPLFPRMTRRIGQLFCVSFAAWLATLPIVAVHFHRVQPWGPISSLLLAPFVASTVGVGLTAIIGAAVAPSFGALAGRGLGLLERGMLALVESCADLPGTDLAMQAPPWWLVILYYVFLLSVAWRFRAADQAREGDLLPEWVRPPQRSPRAAGVLCGITMIILIPGGTIWFHGTAHRDRLTVTWLAVGAGTATAIELPDGSTMLYDAGTLAPYDVAQGVIQPYLRSRGISRADRLFISHPNLDHYSAVPPLIKSFSVGPIVVNEHFMNACTQRAPCRRLLDILERASHPIELLESGHHSFERAGVTFEWLYPPETLEPSVPANDLSSVLRLSYKGSFILLTGDIEEYGQTILLRDARLKADLLALPHHGDVCATTRAFVETVGAEVLVRSSHQRMAETTNGLVEIAGDTPLFNTADVGAVRAVIDANGWRVAGFLDSHRPLPPAS